MTDEADARPTGDDLARMTSEELMRSGAEAGGVHIVHRRDRFPVPGTPTERRAERQVSAMFLLTFFASVAFMVVYIVVPWQFHLGDGNSYAWFTPLLGVCMGIALLSVGAGAIMWAKKLMPEEEVVQDRHDGPSDEYDLQTTGATIVEGVRDTGLGRRPLLVRSLGIGAGALGLMAIFPLGGLLVKPHGMFSTPWKKGVRLIQLDGRPVRPEDMQPGSLATVFPNVSGGRKDANAPAMLIRLRPGQKVQYRRGQSGFSWGDYIAFSKVCTHAGCPVSLYEQQTNRLLCPCHQSQFDVLLDAKPIFGPAPRPLPQLPITVDDEGYFIAQSGFHEAVGPSFWERPND